MPADKNSHKDRQARPVKDKSLNEKVIVAVMILVTFLSAASALLIVTNLDATIILPWLTSERAYYSQPITVFTQSAPDANGRNAYVKMTLIASSSNRSAARALDNQQTIVKSTISQVLRHYSPDSLLEPNQLTLIQQAMADAILQELNIPVDNLYFDRITVQ